MQTRIPVLAGYGCDLFINHKTSNIPLWRKGSGLAAAGLEFLMCSGEEWYVRRKHERTLRPGDRIAVLGRGIAIVEHVDDEHVQARLWNESVLRIRRKEIVWNCKNCRWEVASIAQTGVKSALSQAPTHPVVSHLRYSDAP